MFLFLVTPSLYRRDRFLLYKFWSSTSCKTSLLSVEDQLRLRPLLFIIIIIIIIIIIVVRHDKILHLVD